MTLQRNLNLLCRSTAAFEMEFFLGRISHDWQDAVTAWLILYILKRSMGRNGQLELPLSHSLQWLLVACHFHYALAVKMREMLLTHVCGLSGDDSGKILITWPPI